MFDVNHKIFSCELLIVEDDPLSEAVLKSHLQNGGYTHLRFAKNGKQGLEQIQQQKPDLIILDLMMPEMDGLTFLTHIKANPLWENIPVIVQTAIENEENKIRAFALGASDYVGKPLNPQELLARLRVHLLSTLLLEEISEQKERMRAEMHAAQAMQIRIMPDDDKIQQTEQHYRLNIARHFETSSVMGGDCWGFQPLTKNRLGLYMFDFSGHGMTAAMNVFRMHTLMHELLPFSNHAGTFLSELNSRIYPLIERSEFATMFYGIIDIEANSLEYASAAAPPTLVYRPQANNQEWLDSKGFPLGATAKAIYDTIYTPFSSGDTLLMFSDCLIETEDAHGNVINENTIANSVKRSLASASPHPARHIINHILADFHAHSQNPLEDDLTINVYCRQ